MSQEHTRGRIPYQLGPYRIAVPEDWVEVENEEFDGMCNLLFAFWEDNPRENEASALWMTVNTLPNDVKQKLPDVLTLEAVLPLVLSHSDWEGTFLSVETIKKRRVYFYEETNGSMEGLSAAFWEGQAVTILSVSVAEGGLAHARILLNEIMDSLEPS